MPERLPAGVPLCCGARATFAARRLLAGLAGPIRRQRVEAFPGTLIPASRALDSPIAMACLRDMAPCFREALWCISSRTKAPACVEGLSPRRLASAALRRVAFSGMVQLLPFAERAFELDFDVDVPFCFVRHVVPRRVLCRTELRVRALLGNCRHRGSSRRC